MKRATGDVLILNSLNETTLARYCDDGQIDNSAAERALRGVAIGRRNYLFAGADTGGERRWIDAHLIHLHPKSHFVSCGDSPPQKGPRRQSALPPKGHSQAAARSLPMDLIIC